MFSSDYGDKENSDLAERFGVTKDDFPAYKLFVQGKSEPISYTGDVKNADSIKKFLIKESGKLNVENMFVFTQNLWGTYLFIFV
jgi:hypothetical protein